MITMDNTVVVNAVPTISADLGMSSDDAAWVTTGFILAFSCLMLAGGRMTDVYGCRATFAAGMVVYTAASALCGLAWNAPVLIAGRLLQGAGAAIALPASQVMVTIARTDRQRSRGLIVWSAASTAALALGGPIGGAIVEYAPWGWIFLINVLPGVLAVILSLVLVEDTGPRTRRPLDLPGVLASAVLVFALFHALESGPAAAPLTLAAVALTALVLIERRTRDPMLDLRLLRNGVFVGGLLAQTLNGMGFAALLYYSASFMQIYLGFSPTKAALVMLPAAGVVLILTPVASWLATTIGPRLTVGGGMALMALGVSLFSGLTRAHDFADLMPGVLTVGAGAALCMPLLMYVLKSVPEQTAGVASGVINMFREMSAAFGIAIVGLLIHHIPAPGAGTATMEAFRDTASSGYLLTAALLLLGAVAAALTLPPRTSRARVTRPDVRSSSA